MTAERWGNCSSITPWVARWMKPNRPSSPEDASRSSSGSLASASSSTRIGRFASSKSRASSATSNRVPGRRAKVAASPDRAVTRSCWNRRCPSRATRAGWGSMHGAEHRGRPRGGRSGRRARPRSARDRPARGRPSGPRAGAAACRCTPGAHPRPSGRVSRHWSRGRRASAGGHDRAAGPARPASLGGSSKTGSPSASSPAWRRAVGCWRR